MEDITTNPMPLGKPSRNAIRGVEIFAAGVHNGDTYTDRDLLDMVAAFHALDYKPALKLGHSRDKPGDPAWGWVANVRKVGNKLVADFVGLHDAIYKAIKERLYDRVSAEIYFNLKRGGKMFRRALKAVALLGAEVPAVAGLTPLSGMEFVARSDYGAVSAFQRAFALEPSAEVDRRARDHMERQAEKSYEKALDDVLAADPALARAYATASGALSENPKPNTAGKELDAKAKDRMREGQSRDYAEAVDHVLAAEPELARRYEEERWT